MPGLERRHILTNRSGVGGPPSGVARSPSSRWGSRSTASAFQTCACTRGTSGRPWTRCIGSRRSSRGGSRPDGVAAEECTRWRRGGSSAKATEGCSQIENGSGCSARTIDRWIGGGTPCCWGTRNGKREAGGHRTGTSAAANPRANTGGAPPASFDTVALRGAERLFRQTVTGSGTPRRGGHRARAGRRGPFDRCSVPRNWYQGRRDLPGRRRERPGEDARCRFKWASTRPAPEPRHAADRRPSGPSNGGKSTCAIACSDKRQAIVDGASRADTDSHTRRRRGTDKPRLVENAGRPASVQGRSSARS